MVADQLAAAAGEGPAGRLLRPPPGKEGSTIREGIISCQAHRVRKANHGPVGHGKTQEPQSPIRCARSWSPKPPAAQRPVDDAPEVCLLRSILLSAISDLLMGHDPGGTGSRCGFIRAEGFGRRIKKRRYL